MMERKESKALKVKLVNRDLPVSKALKVTLAPRVLME